MRLTIGLILIFFLVITCGEQIYSQNAEEELELYEYIKYKQSSHEFLTYFENFPNGKHAKKVAKIWLKWLKKLPLENWDLPPQKYVCENAQKVMARRLNIRSRPDAKAKLIGYYSKGRTLCALKKDGLWVLVKYGWVYGKYLKKARYSKKVDDYELYIEVVPFTYYTKRVKSLRQQSLFNWARHKGNIASYDRYLKKYPQGKEASAIRKLREQLRFEQAIAQHHVDGYDTYLKEYPKGQYRSEVLRLKEEAWFQQAISENTVEAYNSFMKAYPRNKKNYYLRKLKRKLLKTAKK